MGRFSAILCFAFVLGLMSSASSKLAPSLLPNTGTIKKSPVQSPKAASPASPSTAPTVSSPASAPSKVATPKSSATTPSAKGPTTASLPTTSSGVVTTPRMERMTIFGAALLGAAVILF